MKRVAAVFFALVMCLALLTGCSFTEGDTSKDAGKADKNGGNGDITFSNVLLSTSASMTTVHGEVKNGGSKACSFTLKVSFYDESNKLLGTASGAVNDINGGDTKLFSAIASGDYSSAASHKVQVDTMVRKQDNKKKTIEFSNTVAKTTAGMTTINGEAKNIDSAVHSFTLSVGAYDAQGKLVGVATGAVNDLAAGDTKTYSAITADDLSSAETYQVYVDTMVK